MLSVGFEHSKRLAQSYIFDLAVSAFDTSIVYQLELAIRRMKYLGIVSSPLCVWKLESVCSQTQMSH